MIKNVYFHIDEIGRDAITASALKKGFAERGINLIYGNRVYTKRVLEKFVFAFDVIILPRPMFLNDFKNIKGFRSFRFDQHACHRLPLGYQTDS